MAGTVNRVRSLNAVASLRRESEDERFDDALSGLAATLSRKRPGIFTIGDTIRRTDSGSATSRRTVLVYTKGYIISDSERELLTKHFDIKHEKCVKFGTPVLRMELELKPY